MCCPCHHFASPGWSFLSVLPIKYPSIRTRVSACCQGSPECSGQPWTLQVFLKMSLIETTVSVHRLLPWAPQVQAQKDARLPTLPAAQLQHFQLETDTQVRRQFWRSLGGLMVKQPNESRVRTSSTWSHVAEVTRRSFFSASADWTCLGKKGGCDCEAMHYSVSWESAATLRTHPCCFQSAQLCVGVLEMQVEHHVAEKWVLWLRGFFSCHIFWNSCSIINLFLTYNWGIFSASI